MGGAKKEMMEAQERGWYDVDEYICLNCVNDNFLKSVIEENFTDIPCTYCGANPAADVNELLPIIVETIKYYYTDPSSAGVPRDSGEWVYNDDFLNVEEVLYELGFEANENFIADLCEAIEDNGFVKAHHGYFFSSPKNEILSWSWTNFSSVVKHQTRYFFKDVKQDDLSPDDLSPSQFLATLENIVKDHDLVKKLPKNTTLFRARGRQYDSSWVVNENTLGAPPDGIAASGRMNPIGISYLYTATDKQTAIDEVIDYDKHLIAVIGKFKATRELNILDLTKIPNLPSAFDPELRDERENLLFLKKFQDEITKPISIDGSEHINYVPTQIISEYFSQSFMLDLTTKLDGIRYRSSKSIHGDNIVLFPHAFEDKSSCIELDAHYEKELQLW